MDDPIIIPPDPNLVELSQRITQRKKRERKQQEWHEHRFEIYHAVLSTVAILISVAALFVSIVSLRLQFQSFEKPAQEKSKVETIETNSSN